MARRHCADLHRAPHPAPRCGGSTTKIANKSPRSCGRSTAPPPSRPPEDALDSWTDSEIGRKYPAIKRQWEAAWEVIPFSFPPEVRKVIYTTNMIESINYQLRKVSKTRGRFPTDDALIKVLYLACREMGRTTRAGQGGRSSYNWKAALNQFDLMFAGRLDRA